MWHYQYYPCVYPFWKDIQSIALSMCETYFKKKRQIRTHFKKAHILFWFPVKDIKISDIFYKIQKIPRNLMDSNNHD